MLFFPLVSQPQEKPGRSWSLVSDHWGRHHTNMHRCIAKARKYLGYLWAKADTDRIVARMPASTGNVRCWRSEAGPTGCAWRVGRYAASAVQKHVAAPPPSRS
ncbi:hypothetical protein RJ55_01351 [Drechmeria coniospora]|nr:hypothetical protein RJ55_01351 [Drechmeria coniospora]